MIIAAQPPALLDFTDDYNRANATTPGGNYRVDFNAMQINNNALQNRDLPGTLARTGSWASVLSTASHNEGRLNTDNWTVFAQLKAPTGGLANDNFTCVGCQMSNGTPGSGTTLVYFAVSTGSGCGILTYQMPGAFSGTGQVGGLTGQTTRLNSTTNATTTSTVNFTRRMYTATRSLFTLTVGGTVLGTWDDTTGIVPAGNALNRRWFVAVESNRPIFQGTYFSVALDLVRVQDNQY